MIEIRMPPKDARTKELNMSSFWHIIFPTIVLLFLLFILFVVYSMPDWAIDCQKDLLPLRKLVEVSK